MCLDVIKILMIKRSLKNYNKDLDLLLINEINHYILIKNINLL